MLRPRCVPIVAFRTKLITENERYTCVNARNASTISGKLNQGELTALVNIGSPLTAEPLK